MDFLFNASDQSNTRNMSANVGLSSNASASSDSTENDDLDNALVTKTTETTTVDRVPNEVIGLEFTPSPGHVIPLRLHFKRIFHSNLVILCCLEF